MWAAVFNHSIDKTKTFTPFCWSRQRRSFSHETKRFCIDCKGVPCTLVAWCSLERQCGWSVRLWRTVSSEKAATCQPTLRWNESCLGQFAQQKKERRKFPDWRHVKHIGGVHWTFQGDKDRGGGLKHDVKTKIYIIYYCILWPRRPALTRHVTPLCSCVELKTNVKCVVPYPCTTGITFLLNAAHRHNHSRLQQNCFSRSITR